MRRKRGDDPVEVGRYAKSVAHQFHLNVNELGLLPSELRKPGKSPVKLATIDGARYKPPRQEKSTGHSTKPTLSPQPTDSELFPHLRNGLGATAAREALGCTLAELNRWAADGRLPQDGEKFFYHIGPRGGSVWGRCWLQESIDAARNRLAQWRQQDAIAKKFRRKGLRLIQERPNHMTHSRIAGERMASDIAEESL